MRHIFLYFGVILFIPSFSYSKTCHYHLKPKHSKVSWTGYIKKNKTPLSGTFERTKFVTKAKTSLKETLKTTQLTVLSTSVKTNSSETDRILIDHIFNKLAPSPFLRASVKELPWGSSGTATVKVTVGSVSRELGLNYSQKDKSEAHFSGEINLSQFMLDDLLSSASIKCGTKCSGKNELPYIDNTISLSFVAKFSIRCGNEGP